MPMGLDSPSSLSPSGHQEQTSQGALPPLPKGTKMDPYQAVKKFALKINPSLTHHDLDYLMHVLESDGVLEKVNKPYFPELLAPIVARISGSVGRVTQRIVGYPQIVDPTTQPLTR